MLSVTLGAGASPVYAASIPTVETRPATSVSETAAFINGRVISDGGLSIVERRFDWGTTSSCADGWTANVGVSGDYFSYYLTGLNSGTTYYFRAWAKNSVGWGQGSVLSFTTGTTLLPAPNLSSPSNGASNVSTTPTFTWSVVSGATSYRILVGTSLSGLPTDPTADTGSGLVINATPTGTSYTPASGILSEGTTYYWEVHARSPSQYGTWSSKWSFTTIRISVYDRQAAYDYAQNYWDEVCSDGYFWDTASSFMPLTLGTNIENRGGYDCAHFVSCAIGNESHEVGGGLNVPSRVPPAYGEPGAANLGDRLLDSGNAEQKTFCSELQMGDVINYDWDGDGW